MWTRIDLSDTDALPGTVYWIDIVMGFSTGFVVIYNLRRKVVTEPKLVAEYYMWHSTFFVDLLAALPLIAEVGAIDKQRMHHKRLQSRIYACKSTLCRPKQGIACRGWQKKGRQLPDTDKDLGAGHNPTSPWPNRRPDIAHRSATSPFQDVESGQVCGGVRPILAYQKPVVN